MAQSVYEVGSLDSQSQAAEKLELHRVLVHVNSYRKLSLLANSFGRIQGMKCRHAAKQ